MFSFYTDRILTHEMLYFSLYTQIINQESLIYFPKFLKSFLPANIKKRIYKVCEMQLNTSYDKRRIINFNIYAKTRKLYNIFLRGCRKMFRLKLLLTPYPICIELKSTSTSKLFIIIMYTADILHSFFKKDSP